MQGAIHRPYRNGYIENLGLNCWKLSGLLLHVTLDELAVDVKDPGPYARDSNSRCLFRPGESFIYPRILYYSYNTSTYGKFGCQ